MSRRARATDVIWLSLTRHIAQRAAAAQYPGYGDEGLGPPAS